MGFTHSSVDHAVFHRRREEGHVVLSVHVDDGAEAGSNDTVLDAFEHEFATHFETSFKGELSWLLAISFTHDCAARTPSMLQTLYIDRLLE